MGNHPYQRSAFGFLILLAFFSSGCSTLNHRTNSRFNEYFEKPIKVTVMPPDIKIQEFTAGGVQLFKEDWSSEAKKNVLDALKEMDPNVEQVEFSFYEPSAITEDQKLFLKSQHGLFNLAAQSIIDHTYVPTLIFQNKVKNFDYTLGEEFSRISQHVNTDAVLYCSGRNYLWTAGRVMMFILAAAVFGDSAYAVVPTGNEYFLMSVVDVKTGDVIWFDAVSQPGDLRHPELDKKLVKQMLEKIPKELAKKKKEQK